MHEAPEIPAAHPFHAEERRGWVKIAAILTLSLGLIVLVGWAWDIGVFRQLLPGLVSMKANTAAAFVLCGTSLYLHTLRQIPPVFLLIRRAAALLVMFIGLVTLGEYAFGWNAGIDQLLFTEPAGAAFTPYPGRMSNITAANFVLMGGALLLMEARFWNIAQAFAFAVVVDVLLPLGGYMFSDLSLTQVGNTTAIAAHTAAGFVLLAVGILAAMRGHGFMVRLRRKSLAIGLATSLVALMVIFGAVSYNFVQKDKASQAVVHTYEVIVILESFSAALHHFLQHNRGFLITGDTGQLAEMDRSRNAMFAQLAEVNRLTSSDPAQQQRLAALDKLVGQRIEWSDRAAQMRREKGAKEAAAMMLGGDADTLTASIEEKLDALGNGEKDLLKERQLIAATVSSSSLLTLGTLLVASLLLLLWVFRVMQHEIAERKRFEDEIRQHRGHLEELVEQRSRELLEAQRIAHIGNWEWNLVSNELKWSDEMYRIFGLMPRQFETSYEVFLHYVHPDDRTAVQKGVEDALHNHIPYSIEHRIIHWDRSEHFVHEQAQVYFDGAGNPVSMIGTVQDITERKQAEEAQKKLHEKLAKYTAQLEATNSELSAFVYSASHVLRAPLRGISGYSRVLLEDFSGALNAEGKRLLNALGKNAMEISRYIDDLLEYSNVGRKEIESSTINMEELARAVVAGLEPLATGRQVRFEVKNLPAAQGDKPMIRQVFASLLSNSVKFTRAKETAVVEVGGRIEEGENVYYVKDNGVGFDMQYANKLFGVFQRLHGDEEFEGTGIGLAIVKRIVEKHGGQVWAESKQGEGATIYFTLHTAPDK